MSLCCMVLVINDVLCFIHLTVKKLLMKCYFTLMAWFPPLALVLEGHILPAKSLHKPLRN